MNRLEAEGRIRVIAKQSDDAGLAASIIWDAALRLTKDNEQLRAELEQVKKERDDALEALSRIRYHAGNESLELLCDIRGFEFMPIDSAADKGEG